jgi:4'-phosphopantetheinyl transferase
VSEPLLPPHITGREVQVWAVHLDAPETHLAQCYSWLSSDEQARAARFHFEEHRRAFVVGRAVLRVLLGGFLETPPEQIQFSYGPKGKPALRDSTPRLRFNVSNSGNLAVYAFTEGCEIGIDVERLRPMPNLEQVAARFFSPEEAAELMALPEQDRTLAFFQCWTRKEAYIKAVGDGLSVALASFQVTLRPGVQAEMLRLDGSAEAAKAWTMCDFIPGPEFIGALAYRDQQRAVLVRPPVNAGELLEGAPRA